MSDLMFQSLAFTEGQIRVMNVASTIEFYMLTINVAKDQLSQQKQWGTTPNMSPDNAFTWQRYVEYVDQFIDDTLGSVVADVVKETFGRWGTLTVTPWEDNLEPNSSRVVASFIGTHVKVERIASRDKYLGDIHFYLVTERAP